MFKWSELSFIIFAVAACNHPKNSFVYKAIDDNNMQHTVLENGFFFTARRSFEDGWFRILRPENAVAPEGCTLETKPDPALPGRLLYRLNCKDKGNQADI